MPVVKNLDLEATTEQTESVARVTMPGLSKTTFDKGTEPLDEPGSGTGLYLVVIVLAAIALRVFLAMLGPGMEPDLALDAAAQHHQQLGEALVDHQRFALPVDELSATFQARAEGPPHTVAEAAARFNRLQEQRGEVDAVFADGLRPETRALPGMPTLMSLFALTGLPLTILILAQCVVGGLLAWPAYLVVSGMLKQRTAALLVAVLVAAHPGMIAAALTLDGTIWVCTLVVLALVPIAQTWFTSGIGLCGGGLALGLASLFQPWVVLIAPFVAAWRAWRERSLGTAGWCAVLVVAAAVPPGAWAFRNYQLGRGLTLTTDARVDLAFGIPAEIAATDSAGEFLHDRPAAVAAAWTDFTQALAESDDAHAAPVLYAFARDRTLGDPIGYLRYQTRHARNLTLDHSAELILPRMGIPYETSGVLAGLIGQSTSVEARDPVARWITEVWIGLNLALLAGMVVGVTFGLVRRQFAIVATVIGVGVVWLVFTPSWAGETSRLPLLLIQGLTIGIAAMPAAPKKPKKAKIGDFDAVVPDAGFTIGPRSDGHDPLQPAATGPGGPSFGFSGSDDDEPTGGRPI